MPVQIAPTGLKTSGAGLQDDGVTVSAKPDNLTLDTAGAGSSLEVKPGVFIRADGTVAFTAAESMGNHNLTNVSDPVNAQDAATKNYVDSVATGLETRDVAAATTTATSAATYNNGVAGVGATLTVNAAEGAFTVDGYAVPLLGRVLIKNQASALQNGVYTVTVVGTGLVPWVLTRALDMDTSGEFGGVLLFVLNGTANANTMWVCTTSNPTVGVTAINFSQFNPQLAAIGAKSVLGNNTSGSAVPVGQTSPIVSGEMTASDFKSTGLTGATSASRYVGATASGAPSSGTFALGDFVIDQTGAVWVCVSAGSPGTWAPIGPYMQSNTQTGDYTLVLTDVGKVIRMNISTAHTLTIPANASVAFPVGTVIEVYGMGAGVVTIAITSDTLIAPDGTTIAKQGRTASLRKDDTTIWVLSGATT